MLNIIIFRVINFFTWFRDAFLGYFTWLGLFIGFYRCLFLNLIINLQFFFNTQTNEVRISIKSHPGKRNINMLMIFFFFYLWLTSISINWEPLDFSNCIFTPFLSLRLRLLNQVLIFLLPFNYFIYFIEYLVEHLYYIYRHLLWGLVFLYRAWAIHW